MLSGRLLLLTSIYFQFASLAFCVFALYVFWVGFALRLFLGCFTLFICWVFVLSWLFFDVLFGWVSLIVLFALCFVLDIGF